MTPALSDLLAALTAERFGPSIPDAGPVEGPTYRAMCAEALAKTEAERAGDFALQRKRRRELGRDTQAAA